MKGLHRMFPGAWRKGVGEFILYMVISFSVHNREKAL